MRRLRGVPDVHRPDFDGGAERVYRSVDEVPARLRNRLLKTTNGANSATILIADRNGRKEIDKAMRKLPGPRSGAWGTRFSAERNRCPLAWLTPRAENGRPLSSRCSRCSWPWPLFSIEQGLSAPLGACGQALRGHSRQEKDSTETRILS